MKFLIFAANLTLVLSFSEPQLEDQSFIIGIKDLDSARLQLPKDEWHLHELFNDSLCKDYILKSIWIFPENYSDILRKPPFGMIHSQTKAFDVGILILYYDNNPVVIPAFCCQHDENMAIYVTYNKSYRRFIIFRKTSTRIGDTTMTPGVAGIDVLSYAETVKRISWCFVNPLDFTNLYEAMEPTQYCLSLFWRLSRYEMEGHEALTIISKISATTLHCRTFLFAEVQNEYFLRYDISFNVDTETEEYDLMLQDNDGVNLFTLGH